MRRRSVLKSRYYTTAHAIRRGEEGQGATTTTTAYSSSSHREHHLPPLRNDLSCCQTEAVFSLPGWDFAALELSEYFLETIFFMELIHFSQLTLTYRSWRSRIFEELEVKFDLKFSNVMNKFLYSTALRRARSKNPLLGAVVDPVGSLKRILIRFISTVTSHLFFLIISLLIRSCQLPYSTPRLFVWTLLNTSFFF